MIKRFLALLLTGVFLVGLVSCDKKEEPKSGETVSHEKQESEPSEEGESEEKIVAIYAKSPEEAADKCLKALYSGNISDAKHYVTPNGNAFKELNSFRDKMMKSFGVSKGSKIEAKAEKLVKNTLSKFNFTRTNVKQTGNEAQVTYQVSMPDMTSINYSRYMDSYMSAMGISQEALMMELEGMNQQEMENWSREFSLDVMNYIFDSNEDFPKANTTTTVHVKKSKKGWLVNEIKNLTM